MPPGMPPMTMRQMEMLQTAQFFQQLHAVKHSKHVAMEACFDKCMDPKDLQTAWRRELDERKRDKEYAAEKKCMSLCHKKYQKAYSMSVDGFKSTPLQEELMSLMAASQLTRAS
eukprot:TRINITY_DN15007_c0_g3_i1.p1 TRINITY_DN15007_c0_g3~~TRINITY_DN15007_c0_g3_i1.p1  ORF type:complete len:131 (+),score=36.38 TRINITY_DN15007_c0_g3_i1:54-395(+)